MKTPLLTSILAAGLVVGSPAATIFTESFESPDVATYTQGSISSSWVIASSDSGFGWNNAGIRDEAGGLFTTDFGSQAFWAGYNGNSGATTKLGAIATIASNTEYSISFNVGRTVSLASYAIRLIAFDGTADSFRDDIQLPIGGATYTILGTATGTVNLTDLSTSGSITWDSADLPSVVGRDLAIQLVGNGGGVLYDNIQVTAIPEPSAVLLGGLGVLLLLRRRKG